MELWAHGWWSVEFWMARTCKDWCVANAVASACISKCSCCAQSISGHTFAILQQLSPAPCQCAMQTWLISCQCSECIFLSVLLARSAQDQLPCSLLLQPSASITGAKVLLISSSGQQQVRPLVDGSKNVTYNYLRCIAPRTWNGAIELIAAQTKW